MARFIVDFEITGEIAVEAETAEEAAREVAHMFTEDLIENCDGYNRTAGKHYVNEIEEGASDKKTI